MSESTILKIAATVLLSHSMPISLKADYISDFEILLEPSLSIIWKAFLIEILDCFIALKNK